MEWESTSSVKYTGAKDGYAPGELSEDNPNSVRRTMDIDVNGGVSNGVVKPLTITNYTVTKFTTGDYTGKATTHNPDYPHGNSTHNIPNS